MYQLVGDVGSADRVSLEDSVQFFAKWGKWFFPRETISTTSECLVKNGPLRALGTLVLLQPDTLHRRWPLSLSPAQFPNQGSGEPGDPIFVSNLV